MQWGSGGIGEFYQPIGVATDAVGHVFVADSGNDRIQEFTWDGDYVGGWGSTGNGDGEFNNPLGLATDADGNLYVADQANNRIQKFGHTQTPTKTASWGRIKKLYR